ncbi:MULTISPECIES: 2-phospho-L-lactate guanylyltransferase [unclassified Novosphingobium]|uniref:2-phospho-L-lactate guanylyltransferase n=1 Tax=Novosphingobium pentaromativorans TaxID=205844 RepID=A0A2W5NSK3_9SPHN|nr:2-phospho-L-lactate guanylyltransferase [Novosphingobium sp. TCA1]PZQ53655.1 MAG: 2-phospho-L-lactate guanylyltransferase [Novosphingobium pentaromativorans]
MRNWIAVVPWKQGRETKSRLAPSLSARKRQALACTMAAHVVGCLSGIEAIESTFVLAPASVEGWPVQWLRDSGFGLNGELNRIREHFGSRPLLVIHADLPALVGEDVEALLAAARGTGRAFAPDRHGKGTNAIALADSGSFTFAFGPGSLAHHRAQSPAAAIVERAGLGFDLDTPADLEHAVSRRLIRQAA